MKEYMFSIVIVTLNPGNDLIKTLDSIVSQSFLDYEIIIKDGCSRKNISHSIRNRYPLEKVKIITKSDLGIYDAMNQSIKYIEGKYVLFLNAGDTFYDDIVLEKVDTQINKNNHGLIYYGDNYTENRNGFLLAPKKMTDYFCFTKVLCHQSTFYSSDLLRKKIFDVNYKIAADIQYYVSQYIEDSNSLKYIPVVISSYKGDGVSETPKNKKLTIKEHVIILKKEFSRSTFYKNRFRQIITLNIVKKWLSYQRWAKKFYDYIAKIFYSKREA